MLVKPGGSDVGLESGGLGGFLCLHERVVGAILELRQPQHEHSARVLLDVRYQLVVFVLTQLIRPVIGVTRRSVAGSLVVVPNSRQKISFPRVSAGQIPGIIRPRTEIYR